MQEKKIPQKPIVEQLKSTARAMSSRQPITSGNKQLQGNNTASDKAQSTPSG